MKYAQLCDKLAQSTSVYGMELGGPIQSLPILHTRLALHILTKLVKKKKIFTRSGYFSHFTTRGGDRTFIATFSTDRSDLLCKVVKSSANTANAELW